MNILALKTPEELFSAPENIHDEYRNFAKQFHPDFGGNTDAFQKLNDLYSKAKELIKLGEWNIPGLLVFNATDGHQYKIRYLKDFDIGIGIGYLNENIVAYVFSKDKKDLIDSATLIMKNFKFPNNENIKKSIPPTLPKLKKVFETIDKIVMVFEKPATAIRLRDAIDYYKGKIDRRHIVWVMSRCYNFACYLEWMKYCHNDLSLDSIFINPETHQINVIGGWWYASPIGSRMKRLQSRRTVIFAPQKVLSSKLGSISTDLELIRLLGREMMGDENGLHLSKNPENPKYLISWCKMINSGSARTDYTNWDKNLEKIFGKRTFTKMPLTFDNVYKS